MIIEKRQDIIDYYLNDKNKIENNIKEIINNNGIENVSWETKLRLLKQLRIYCNPNNKQEIDNQINIILKK